MKNKQIMRVWTILLAFLPFWPVGTQAVGYRLPNQDPDAIARGNAFVATADNPSAIYYNPAGITQLEGQNLRAGLYMVSGGYEYESPSGAKSTADSDFQPVPQLYYVCSPKDIPLSFGLGVYCPYGLSLDWGRNTPFWTVAEKGSLLYLTVNPVIAWKVHPALSIAVGPTINYSEADFQHGIASPFPGMVPDGQARLQGNGWAYGLNAGLRWQPHEKWAFGLNYRSPTTVDYDGTSVLSPAPYSALSSSTTASIRFPQFIMVGVSFRPTPDWNLEFDLDWADWDVVKHISIGTTSLPLNYRSSFMYEFGVTRQLGKGYFASLGFFYSENSSPDHDFNPAIPDTDLYLGSIGVGYKGKHWDFTFAYQFGYNPGRDVTADQSYPSANGTYHVLNQAFNIAATLKF
jgi:long-chain fatty acid transport protein